MEWYEVAGAVSGVIVLIILLGASWALLRGSYNSARVKELREDNDDLRKRLGDAEGKINESALREHALEIKVTGQSSEILLLTSLVTQRAEVDEVKGVTVDVLQELKNHHAAAQAQWVEMNIALKALADQREAS